MTIVAALGVLDEVELVGRSIDHLRTIGVDRIIVTDYGSTDGTLDVIEQQRTRGGVSVTRVSADERSRYGVTNPREVRLAREAGADWVVFLDADELWIPRGGTLRACRQLASADVLVARRFNVPVTPDGARLPADLTPARHGDLWLHARRVPDFQRYLDEHPDASFVSVVPGPKVMARPALVDAVGFGNHDVASDRPGLRRAPASDILVAHVPFTTFERFERKVNDIRREMRIRPGNFAGALSWHWSRWVRLADAGLLAEEFARQVTDEPRLRDLRAGGLVKSAAEIFAELEPRA